MLSLGVLVHFQQSEAKNFQIILENIFVDLFHVLMQFSFSTSETKLGYYHKKCKNTSCLASCRMTQKTLEKSLKRLELKPSIQPAPQKASFDRYSRKSQSNSWNNFLEKKLFYLILYFCLQYFLQDFLTKQIFSRLSQAPWNLHLPQILIQQKAIFS